MPSTVINHISLPKYCGLAIFKIIDHICVVKVHRMLVQHASQSDIAAREVTGSGMVWFLE